MINSFKEEKILVDRELVSIRINRLMWWLYGCIFAVVVVTVLGLILLQSGAWGFVFLALLNLGFAMLGFIIVTQLAVLKTVPKSLTYGVKTTPESLVLFNTAFKASGFLGVIGVFPKNKPKGRTELWVGFGRQLHNIPLGASNMWVMEGKTVVLYDLRLFFVQAEIDKLETVLPEWCSTVGVDYVRTEPNRASSQVAVLHHKDVK